VVLFAAVLPSFTSDRVPWGNSKNDGLYLLVIPLYLFPLVIFLSVLKAFLVKGKDKKSKSRLFYPMMILLLDTALITSASEIAFLFAIMLSLILCVALVRETLSIKNVEKLE
jgi:hypothetical protein